MCYSRLMLRHLSYVADGSRLILSKIQIIYKIPQGHITFSFWTTKIHNWLCTTSLPVFMRPIVCSRHYLWREKTCRCSLSTTKSQWISLGAASRHIVAIPLSSVVGVSSSGVRTVSVRRHSPLRIALSLMCFRLGCACGKLRSRACSRAVLAVVKVIRRRPKSRGLEYFSDDEDNWGCNRRKCWRRVKE